MLLKGDKVLWIKKKTLELKIGMKNSILIDVSTRNRKRKLIKA